MLRTVRTFTRASGRRLRALVERMGHGVLRLVGVDEIGLLLALVLLGLGSREVWRPAGYLVPGLVLLWIFLPARTPFLTRHAADDRTRRS